jgi:hypothetical protein
MRSNSPALRTPRSAIGALGGARLDIAADPHAEGFYLHVGAHRVGVVPSTPAGRVLPLLAVHLRR